MPYPDVVTVRHRVENYMPKPDFIAIPYSTTVEPKPVKRSKSTHRAARIFPDVSNFTKPPSSSSSRGLWPDSTNSTICLSEFATTRDRRRRESTYSVKKIWEGVVRLPAGTTRAIEDEKNAPLCAKFMVKEADGERHDQWDFFPKQVSNEKCLLGDKGSDLKEIVPKIPSRKDGNLGSGPRSRHPKPAKGMAPTLDVVIPDSRLFDDDFWSRFF